MKWGLFATWQAPESVIWFLKSKSLRLGEILRVYIKPNILCSIKHAPSVCGAGDRQLFFGAPSIEKILMEVKVEMDTTYVSSDSVHP